MYLKKQLLPLLLSICFTSPIFAASIPSISHLDSDLQRSINYACQNAKISQGPARYISCIKTQLEEINSITENYQDVEILIQEEDPSYKDIKLDDAIKAIENGESHKIWLSLASQGVDNAQFILGVLYIKGLGENKSMKEAANLINLARQNGSMEVSQEADEAWNEFELWKYE